MVDGLFPESVKDFVFDLHDVTRRSLIPAEQANLYNVFREITAKYFPNSAWPSPSAIANECNHDPLFLALYSELTLRHLHSIHHPNVRDRIEGWRVYCRLFDLLLEEAAILSSRNNNNNNPDETIYLLPDWCFDILHEFLYQFQGFCQFRTSTYTTATKAAAAAAATATAVEAGGESTTSSSGSSSDPPLLPPHIADVIDILNENRDAWAVETVLGYLHRLIAVGTSSSSSVGKKHVSCTYQYLAYFSSVTLSRLECLLGDYRASIEALDVIYNPTAALIPCAAGGEGGDMKSPEELVNSVFPAWLSLTYHAGVSYLMLRRYQDSASILGSICLLMQRGFKTGQLRKIPGSEQFNKLFDRMIALLAILSHICPKSVTDDIISSMIREKHSTNLSKIESGEEGYEDLFVFACPKFVNAAVPDYNQALLVSSSSGEGGGSIGGDAGCNPSMPFGQDAYKLQVHHFMNEMAAHSTLRKMRSYMALYTSIEIDKLASFHDMKMEEFEPWLVCFKNKLRQLERGEKVTASYSTERKGMVQKGVSSKQDKVGTALDVHFNVSGNVVHVAEAEKTRRFETYFMKQILNNDEILRQLRVLKIEN